MANVARIVFKNGKMSMEMDDQVDAITCEEKMKDVLHPRLLEGANVESTETYLDPEKQLEMQYN